MESLSRGPHPAVAVLHRVLPDTKLRWAATLVLFLTMLVVPPRLLRLFEPPAQPLTVGAVAAKATWEPGNHSFIVRSGPWTYHTACPVVWISRFLVTTQHPLLPIAAEPVEGVDGPKTNLATRREFATKPLEVPWSTIRVRVPQGVNPEDVLGIVQDVDVPTNAPCANGFSGRFRLYESVIPSLPGEERITVEIGRKP